MGNIVAHCAEASRGAGFSAPTAEPAAQPSDAASSYPSPSPFENNPGTYEDLHKKCKDVFPMYFDGAKIMLSKGLSQHFQVSHTVSLSPTINGYRFGATYVGSGMLGPQEAYPVLLGDTDLSGNLSATVIHHLTDKIRCKASWQIQRNQFAAVQLTGDYRGRVATSSLTVANTDLVNESGIIVGQYLRRVLPSLDLGLELIYQYGRQVPGRQFSVLNYAGRYTGKDFTCAATIGSSGFHLSYYHKQQENMQFGVEWESSFRLGESVATFGYQLDLPKANVTFRASCDTQWTVCGVLEKKLPPMPFTLALSGMLNHTKQQSKFGIGLVVG